MVQWRGRRQSRNLEDRRGQGGLAGASLKLGGGGILLVILLSFLFGVNPLEVLQVIGGSSASTSGPAAGGGAPPPEDEAAQFVSVILAATEDTWNERFAALGAGYRPPRLVLFEGAVASACGTGSAAVGPFYCPADQRIYIDLGFFRQLRALGAPGDFAQAYVIAHEVGHHVQNLLGTSERVRQAQAAASPTRVNELSVGLELQADCYAGVWGFWANRERGFLEPGDVEEGLQAAAAIGDDTLQRRSGGRVQPESWTHGSSDQRKDWLLRGLESGRVEACETFGG